MRNGGAGDAEDIWDTIGFLISSKYRIAALRQLVDNPSTPTSIASRADLQITHVSRALRALAARSLVELRVSAETTKGRIYGTTDRGELLWQRIQAAGMLD